MAKKLSSTESNGYYKEESYSVVELSLDKLRTVPLKKIFNSNDYGVIVVPFESKLARDNNITVVQFYKSLEDNIKVKFLSGIPSSKNSDDTTLEGELQSIKGIGEILKDE